MRTVTGNLYFEKGGICDHAIAEMRKYVGSLLEHPTYRKFCQMMQLNQDEFASNILDDAIKAIT
jgi:hypothetical protein